MGMAEKGLEIVQKTLEKHFDGNIMEMARWLGNDVSYSVLSNWVNRKSSPRFNKAGRILDRLGCLLLAKGEVPPPDPDEF